MTDTSRPAQEQNMPEPFYGAQCPSYPACSGQAEFIKKVVEALRQRGSHQVVADLIAALAQGSISDQESDGDADKASSESTVGNRSSEDAVSASPRGAVVAGILPGPSDTSCLVEEKREANAIWRAQNDEKWRQAMRDLREMFILGEDLKVMERRIFDLIMFGPEVVAVVKGDGR